MKNKIIILTALFIVGCCKDNNIRTGKSSSVLAQSPQEIKRIERERNREFMDKLSFKEAFRIHHVEKGEGHTFLWKGDRYTTDLLKEEKNENDK